MNTVIQQIKDECWDGQDKHCDNIDSGLATTAYGVQKQIDAIKYAGIVFVLTNEGKLAKYVVEKKGSNEVLHIC